MKTGMLSFVIMAIIVLVYFGLLFSISSIGNNDYKNGIPLDDETYYKYKKRGKILYILSLVTFILGAIIVVFGIMGVVRLNLMYLTTPKSFWSLAGGFVVVIVVAALLSYQIYKSFKTILEHHYQYYVPSEESLQQEEYDNLGNDFDEQEQEFVPQNELIGGEEDIQPQNSLVNETIAVGDGHIANIQGFDTKDMAIVNNNVQPTQPQIKVKPYEEVIGNVTGSPVVATNLGKWLNMQEAKKANNQPQAVQNNQGMQLGSNDLNLNQNTAVQEQPSLLGNFGNNQQPMQQPLQQNFVQQPQQNFTQQTTMRKKRKANNLGDTQDLSAMREELKRRGLGYDNN